MSSTLCPRCSIPITYQEAGRGLTWVTAELMLLILTFFVIAAFACIQAEQFAAATILGIAGLAVFILIIRRRDKLGQLPGLFYCSKCQHYYSAENIGG